MYSRCFGGLVSAASGRVVQNTFGFHFAFRTELAQLPQTSPNGAVSPSLATTSFPLES
jgi:hypothetical protein